MIGLTSLASNTVSSLGLIPVPVESAGDVVTMVIDVGKAISNVWEKHKAELHQKAVSEIIFLWKNNLHKIHVPGHGESRGFPEIIKLEGNDEIICLKLSDEEIEGLGNSPFYGVDTSLLKYRDEIKNAINVLKLYYQDRIKSDQERVFDPKSVVLVYSMYHLHTHCLNFQGYNADYAYLKGMLGFINGYASLHGKDQNDEQWARVSEAEVYIQNALDLLEEHKSQLSLQNIIAHLRGSCHEYSDNLLINFIKLIVPMNHARRANTITSDQIISGVIRKKYEKKIFNKKLIQLSNSIFKDWVMQLADYSLKALSTDSIFSENDLNSLRDMFEFPDKAMNILQDLKDEIKKKTLNKNDIEDVEAKLSKIKQIFKNAPNFVTTKLSKDPNKPFIPVTDDMEVVERIKFLCMHAKLIKELKSLQYLCTYFLKSIRRLGEIYVQDPEHFNNIFLILDQFCILIRQTATEIKDAIKKNQHVNKNKPRLAEQKQLQTNLENLLEDAISDIKTLGAQIKDQRDKVKECSIEESIQLANYEMLEIAQITAKMHPELPSEKEMEQRLLDEMENISKELVNKKSMGIYQMPGLQRINSAKVSMQGISQYTEKTQALLNAIRRMDEYGETLHNNDVSKGIVAMELATKLRRKAVNFFNQQRTQVEITEFQDDFENLLNSKNREMSKYRLSWGTIILNIAIALTGIGILVITGQLIYSSLRYDRALFFGQKALTSGEERLEDVRKSMFEL